MMKGLLITISLLLLGGCASMESAFSPEVRYGQLYALENALTTAGNQCGNEEAAFTATYWASATVNNIAEHSEFLETGSAPQTKSRELVKLLYTLQYNSANPESQCQQLAMAGSATRSLITLLNN
jgi:uncharacterized protein YceK